MSIFSMLYTFIISPLELLFEVIFMVANKIIGNEGISIIFLSLAVNALVLPLYKRADELQAEERDIQAKMAPMIKHIKKTFKGDERFMMLQTYYRHNHYKPIYALKSSVSLLLQIPFFIAAYNLLSGMQSLQGMQFGFIADLGKEDAMFTIGSFPINVLPIAMTLINIISGIIYTKGHPLKAKIQVYGLAAIFLVLLYHSPAGLVFYWLLNNVFSLVKNIFYKLKNPKKVLNIILAIVGAVILVLTVIRPDLDIRQKVLLSIGCLLLALPLALSKIKLPQKLKTSPKSSLIFFSGAAFMACFTGIFIPARVINASVSEFTDAILFTNPVTYIVNAFLLAAGSFLLWGGVFYFFMSDKMKSVFSEAVLIICGSAIADFMLFGTNLGNMSSALKYDLTPSFKIYEYLLNFAVILAVAALFHFMYSRFQKISGVTLCVGVFTVAGLGLINTGFISNIYKGYLEEFKVEGSEEEPAITLSKNGKNVIVLMLDRSMGTEVPYIFNEKPELLEQFDGFTYYPNTISYGAYTIFGSPALYGGYEYTPERINARETETLESKHDEALNVMPVLFGREGYNVTIFDPSIAGLKWVPDLSIYDEHPEFNCYNAIGHFNYFEDDSATLSASIRMNEIRNRNFFCFSLMKVSPLLIQETIYDGGLYNESISVANTEDGSLGVSSIVQTMDGISKSYGYDSEFLKSYAVLMNLSNITTINDSSENNFLMMTNDATHSPCLLQEPDYVPALNVDNTAYDTDMAARYTIDGKTMEMTQDYQVT
nr:YidC/Oxa1 family membrane protein insertase [Saccharofermentans sp.]